MPPEPIHGFDPHHARGSLADKGQFLLGIDFYLGKHIEQFFRIDRELGEHVGPVLVDPAEPGQFHAMGYARQALDPRLVFLRQHVGDRYLVPHHDAQGGMFAGGRSGQFPQGGLEGGEQEQAHRHAQHRQHQPPLVAKRVAQDEPRDGHATSPSSNSPFSR